MCIVQQLKPADYEQREDFAVRIQMLLGDHESAVIVMSDEAHFHSSGEINKQNFRYWSPGGHLTMVLRLGITSWRS
ncbi:unnamed protein product, partial [Callosobruchus maculatus]